MVQISKALHCVPSLPVYPPLISYHPYRPTGTHQQNTSSSPPPSPHPLHPLLSSALCNYNQICKPQKVDSPPCILITVASPLEQTSLQDAEFTDNLFWN